MSKVNLEEKDLLLARIEDALERCERGIPATLSFLTPRQRRWAEASLAQRGATDAAFFWGGYPDAERVTLFLLPEYLLICLSRIPSLCEPAEVLSLLEDSEREVTSLRITGSGFRTLCHRDYLGSILNLGLERDVLGDIAVQNEHEAVLFCTSTVARFLLESLERVANDKVTCRLYSPDDTFTDGRRYQPISDTVASPRLDCVVAALTNLSREAAQNAIRSGLVELEYEVEERTDLSLTPPAVLSVRGYGRFVLRSFDGETRKGRLRLRADKLI